jgi:hypothetical protein
MGAGTMPKISVINESAAISDSEVQSYIPAFTQQWNIDLKNAWAVDSAEFVISPKGTKPQAGSWWLAFLDDSDQAKALAYHDLTNDGMPISKVFVKTLKADKASISVGATHELCEMAVDPWLNSAYQDPQGQFWAGEICDPVEDGQYGYMIGDVLVTDFVTPAWFAPKFATGPMDLKGHAQSAFQILSAGYAQVFDPQQGWQQVNGSRSITARHAVSPDIGSRRERRTRNGDLQPSDVRWSKK